MEIFFNGLISRSYAMIKNVRTKVPESAKLEELGSCLRE